VTEQWKIGFELLFLDKFRKKTRFWIYQMLHIIAGSRNQPQIHWAFQILSLRQLRA
jgi:hypothetical protein